MQRLSGTIAQRPAATAAVGDRYYATDEQIIYFSTGQDWLPNIELDIDSIVGQFSSNGLDPRPPASSCVGYLYTDISNGKQYEAFPSDWAELPEAVASGGGLYNNTAFVDPSGNDGTAVIGDPDHKFALVQAAVTAFEDKLLANPTDDPETYVVDVGNNYFNASVSTSLPSISFVGIDYELAKAFNSLTLTNGGFGSLKMCRCNGSTVVATYFTLTVLLQCGGIEQITTSGNLKIGCDVMGFGEVTGPITAGGNVEIMGLRVCVGPISAPGFGIHISDSAPRYSNLADGSYGFGLITIDSAGSEVWATNSMLGDVTCATLHLIDSRVQGTITAASPPLYEDVLLKATRVTDSAATGGTVNATGHPLETIHLTSGSTIVSITVDIGKCPNQGIIRLHSKSIITALTVAATGGTFEDAALATLAAGGNAAWQNDNGVFLRIQ